MKRRVALMLRILTSWKEYTNVLALTSAQILHNQHGVDEERVINKTLNKV